MLQIKWWSQAYNESDIEVRETLTRYVDAANNSDKYRRFISLHVPGETPVFFTHTGRWTHPCDYDQWGSVGTYRPSTQPSRAAWNRAHLQADTLHNTWVDQKKGDYTVVTQGAGFRLLSAGNPMARTWMMACPDGLATTVQAPAISTPAVAVSVTSTPSTPVRNTVTSNVTTHVLSERIALLMRQVNDPDSDPFDLLPNLSTLREQVTNEMAVLELIQRDLEIANEALMERI